MHRQHRQDTAWPTTTTHVELNGLRRPVRYAIPFVTVTPGIITLDTWLRAAAAGAYTDETAHVANIVIPPMAPFLQLIKIAALKFDVHSMHDRPHTRGFTTGTDKRSASWRAQDRKNVDGFQYGVASAQTGEKSLPFQRHHHESRASRTIILASFLQLSGRTKRLCPADGEEDRIVEGFTFWCYPIPTHIESYTLREVAGNGRPVLRRLLFKDVYLIDYRATGDYI